LTEIKKQDQADLKVGCCGFGMAHSKYFQTFPLVEIQQSFYQPPKLATVTKWRAGAPEDFEFSLKAWQLITHEPTSPTYRKMRMEISPRIKQRYGSFKPTNEVYAAWDSTAKTAMALRARMVVFQSPSQFKPIPRNINNLQTFMREVDRHGLRFIWEPRGDWDDNLIKSLCSDLDLIHGVDPFKSESVSVEPTYFRLNGIKGYYSRFEPDDLAQLIEKCQGKKKVYCLFNNVNMVKDALALLELLREDGKKGSGEEKELESKGDGESGS